MGGFSQYTDTEESSGLRPVLIALGVIAVIAVLIYALSRSRGGSASSHAMLPLYASNLQIRDLHMSTAENFVGGKVTYVEGKVANTGDKSVTGARVETVFRNTLGEVVDKQEQPLRVEAAPLGHPDWVSLNTAPLGPGAMAGFRLTFEHISADWNQGYPEINFTSVQTK
jgi:hypothetical protein